ncbi:hypothetical protein [Microvirga tunisiensis]|uniref:Uncharacterized protein n=1 Tax=Microvirga tunisiensis TaxID=2108360 RepID=A0A5N7MSJ5_9HYPH|nr:hypothetical protein [Microvirga tunisiensis]MPR12031.1 hypothetical protein [Microvirga tunisiensis]MPR29967.1 hypothetical protein [Microvirga tunisiensis]
MVIKLEEHISKPAVRRFFGKESTASDISAKKRLGRDNIVVVLMREERVSKTYSERATKPSMVGPRRPLAQATTISSFRAIILPMMWSTS